MTIPVRIAGDMPGDIHAGSATNYDSSVYINDPDNPELTDVHSEVNSITVDGHCYLVISVISKEISFSRKVALNYAHYGRNTINRYYYPRV